MPKYNQWSGFPLNWYHSHQNTKDNQLVGKTTDITYNQINAFSHNWKQRKKNKVAKAADKLTDTEKWQRWANIKIIGVFNPTKKTASEMKGGFPDMNEINEYEG